jgi:hypothetical protein
MVVVNGAMFPGAFRFISAGTSAAVHGRVAVDLLEQGIAAIGNTAADHAKRASLADGRAGFPLGIDSQGADAAETGGGEFAERFQEKTGYAGRGC